MSNRLAAVLPVLLAVTAASCSSPSGSDTPAHYRISVRLEPAIGLIDASVDLSLPPISEDTATLSFYLHRQLTIETVAGPLVAGYEYDLDPPGRAPWMPQAAELRVHLNRPLRQGEFTEIHFEYGGNVTVWPEWSANVITDDWTEIGLYLPWFPYNGDDFGQFTYEVDVAMESSYVARGLGDVSRTARGWSWEWRRPTNDIVLAAAEDLRTVALERGGQSVQFHVVTLDDSAATGIADDVLGILQLYEAWFGESDLTHLTLVESLRDRGGGYARQGLIVLGQLSVVLAPEHRADYISYVAHEAAHGWWNRAPANSWQDWLNESFAEYAALLVIRHQLGERAFDGRVDEKRYASAGTAAIWGLPRADVATEQKAREVNLVLYSKGPVILDRLADRIGVDRFLDWCRNLVHRQVGSTDVALDLLAELEGNATSRWFRELLHTQ